MHGVLIVDDEKYVRMWIRNCINWADYDLEIVGEAYNGKDALEKIRLLQPRIVISDMDMPGMDGAVLIRKVNEFNPDILFLILSGYNTYEFMRSAVCHNAVDYLLKPIEVEALKRAVEKMRQEIFRHDQILVHRSQVETIQLENHSLRARLILLDLLDGQIYSELEIADKLQFFSDGASHPLKVLSILIDVDNRFSAGSAEFPDTIQQDIRASAEQQFRELGFNTWFVIRQKECIGLLTSNDSDDLFEQKIIAGSQKILNDLACTRRIPAALGLGSTIHEWSCVSASYSEARRALALRYLYGSNHILSFLEVPGDLQKDIISNADEQELADAIHQSSLERGHMIINNIFDRFGSVHTISPETIKMVYYRFVSLILKGIYAAGISPSYLKIEEIELFTTIDRLNSLDRIQQWIVSLFDSACKGIASTQEIKSSAVAKARQFIEARFTTELTLTDIARQVYLTPSYLSALFKSETGQNIMDYITELRIREVKNLMKNPTLKTYDIGVQVGYANPKYFCRVFKKVTGQSPSQYRRTIGC